MGRKRKTSLGTLPFPFMRDIKPADAPPVEAKPESTEPALYKEPPAQSQASVQKYHEAFYSQREKALDSLADAYKSYDQALITLSAGALGVSVSFVKDFVPKPLPYTSTFLCLSWVGFGLSLVLILASFRSSQEAIDRNIELQDESFRRHGQPVDGENPALERTKFYNKWSFRAFMAGVAFLVLFSILNYPGAAR